jgi:DNA-directed RNA polymerase specialized sigma24 family protein
MGDISDAKPTYYKTLLMAKNKTVMATAEHREAFFMALYKKAFPTVARYIARMGGSLEEAQDIFQDALVVYYEKASSKPNEIVLSEKAYLVGIARKLWLQRYKASNKIERLNDLDTEVVPEERLSTAKILYYLETTGQKCMELLKAYYYDCLPVGNVAEVFGYSGTRSATVAKYKCLEKVRETVKKNALNYADFFE